MCRPHRVLRPPPWPQDKSNEHFSSESKYLSGTRIPRNPAKCFSSIALMNLTFLVGSANFRRNFSTSANQSCCLCIRTASRAVGWRPQLTQIRRQAVGNSREKMKVGETRGRIGINCGDSLGSFAKLGRSCDSHTATHATRLRRSLAMSYPVTRLPFEPG